MSEHRADLEQGYPVDVSKAIEAHYLANAPQEVKFELVARRLMDDLRKMKADCFYIAAQLNDTISYIDRLRN